ncbi:hypothetical protein BDW02DRAFT_478134, partial [Decorospora gaudefroyi]
EEAWIMLHHAKVRAVIEAGHNIKIPGPVPVMEAFNTYFAGKVFKDEMGEGVLPPRPTRDLHSIRGKLGNR